MEGGGGERANTLPSSIQGFNSFGYSIFKKNLDYYAYLVNFKVYQFNRSFLMDVGSQCRDAERTLDHCVDTQTHTHTYIHTQE